MTTNQDSSTKRTFGQGFHSTYAPNHLTLGIGFPIESYSGPIATMDLQQQVEIAKLAEQGGFATLWCRDVPLFDPSFGDAGQMFDPWVWLSYISAHTSRIALGTGSIILPLRQPLDLAKAATSVDQLNSRYFGLSLSPVICIFIKIKTYTLCFKQTQNIFLVHINRVICKSKLI